MRVRSTDLTVPAGHSVWQELLGRDRTLALFGLVLLLAMLPSLLALGLDVREVRGVPVWVKPLKFMASIALFAWTTAWFSGLLAESARRRPLWRASVWTLVIAGGMELAYIVVMAALGEASHYNATTPWHARAYLAMGAGAMAMTATQLVLAALLWQQRAHVPAAHRGLWRAVLTGLVLTFVLGAGAGAMLASVQPPPGTGLPVFGWHLTGADLRPAHFLGLHAQQLLPLGALLLPRRGWWPFVVTYVLCWAAAMALGLQGASFSPPPVS